jgi:hypothetical protein
LRFGIVAANCTRHDWRLLSACGGDDVKGAGTGRDSIPVAAGRTLALRDPLAIERLVLYPW